jgi:catechol 2,3-dioxygenase-like lactoylglutathione lyase family enzyme
MLRQSPVITFIPTRNREQAREFYRDVLSLHLVSEEPMALVFNANGVMC